MSDFLEKIKSDKFTKHELENIICNANSKGRIDLLEAAKIALAKYDKSNRPKIIKKMDGYYITDVACDNNGNVLNPKLIEIATALVDCPFVDEIAILKTEVRFYLKGRHMLAGVAGVNLFRVGLLDENKIKDSTIERWKEVGVIVKGQYFDATYVDVHFSSLAQITKAIGSVEFA
ncbi:hypothetical protein [Chitinibacter bivalviorum]|nr:hypothetical protein [Chitinibacter bivalviorum]